MGKKRREVDFPMESEELEDKDVYRERKSKIAILVFEASVRNPLSMGRNG